MARTFVFVLVFERVRVPEPDGEGWMRVLVLELLGALLRDAVPDFVTVFDDEGAAVPVALLLGVPLCVELALGVPV